MFIGALLMWRTFKIVCACLAACFFILTINMEEFSRHLYLVGNANTVIHFFVRDHKYLSADVYRFLLPSQKWFKCKTGESINKTYLPDMFYESKDNSTTIIKCATVNDVETAVSKIVVVIVMCNGIELIEFDVEHYNFAVISKLPLSLSIGSLSPACLHVLVTDGPSALILTDHSLYMLRKLHCKNHAVTLPVTVHEAHCVYRESEKHTWMMCTIQSNEGIVVSEHSRRQLVIIHLMVDDKDNTEELNIHVQYSIDDTIPEIYHSIITAVMPIPSSLSSSTYKVKSELEVSTSANKFLFATSKHQLILVEKGHLLVLTDLTIPGAQLDSSPTFYYLKCAASTIEEAEKELVLVHYSTGHFVALDLYTLKVEYECPTHHPAVSNVLLSDIMCPSNLSTLVTIIYDNTQHESGDGNMKPENLLSGRHYTITDCLGKVNISSLCPTDISMEESGNNDGDQSGCKASVYKAVYNQLSASKANLHSLRTLLTEKKLLIHKITTDLSTNTLQQDTLPVLYDGGCLSQAQPAAHCPGEQLHTHTSWWKIVGMNIVFGVDVGNQSKHIHMKDVNLILIPNRSNSTSMRFTSISKTAVWKQEQADQVKQNTINNDEDFSAFLLTWALSTQDSIDSMFRIEFTSEIPCMTLATVLGVCDIPDGLGASADGTDVIAELVWREGDDHIRCSRQVTSYKLTVADLLLKSNHIQVNGDMPKHELLRSWVCVCAVSDACYSFSIDSELTSLSPHLVNKVLTELGLTEHPALQNHYWCLPTDNHASAATKWITPVACVIKYVNEHLLHFHLCANSDKECKLFIHHLYAASADDVLIMPITSHHTSSKATLLAMSKCSSELLVKLDKYSQTSGEKEKDGRLAQVLINSQLQLNKLIGEYQKQSK